MKTMQKLFAIAILALACAVGAAAQAAPGIQQPGSGALAESAGVPWQIAGVWTFNASSPPTDGFNVVGLKYFQLVFVPSGTVSTCAISFDSSTNAGTSFTTGGLVSAATIGSCASATTYANSSALTATLTGQLTPTITGSGQVTVTMFGYINNPGAAGSASSTIISPVDGSGYVNIDCKTGCTGGNANGQATMANSAPVVIASNQSALPANVTQVNSVALGSPSAYGTSPGAVNVLGVNAFVTNAVAVTGTFWQATQPVSGTVTTTPPANASSNITQLNSVALGSPSNYGTSPGAVSVAGVNAFVTNAVGVTGTFWQATQPVSGTVTTTPPANASINITQIAGSTVVADPCQINARSTALINLTASGQIIAGTSAKQTYVCYLQFALGATADNVALVEGNTTGNCGTGTTAMAGGATAATGWNLLANGSVTSGTISNWAFKTATLANNVCLLASSGAQISGTVQYVQQ